MKRFVAIFVLTLCLAINSAPNNHKISYFLDKGVLKATTGQTTTPTMIGADTVKKPIYETIKNLEKSTDSTKVIWYDRSFYYIVNTTNHPMMYRGTFDENHRKAFRIDYILRDSIRIKPEVTWFTNSYLVYLLPGDTLDPGYSVASQPATIAITIKDLTSQQLDTGGTGLAHSWNFNIDTLAIDSSADSTGSIIAFLDSGAVIIAAGKIGGAVSLDGTDDLVNVGDLAVLNGNPAYITISMWANQTSIANVYYFDKTLDANNQFLSFSASTGATTYWQLRYAGTYKRGYFTTATYITAGEWYNITFVYNGDGAADTDKMKMYVNGVETSLTFDFASLNATLPTMDASDLTLGGEYGSSDGFVGEIDNVQIYTTALSAIEVSTIYASERENFQGIDTWDTTQTGEVFLDTAFNGIEVDTVIYYVGTDTITSPLVDSGMYLQIESLLTEDDTTTFYAIATNNVGRANAVQHTVYYDKSYSSITQIQRKIGGSDAVVASHTETFDSAPTENNLLVVMAVRRSSGSVSFPSGWSIAVSGTFVDFGHGAIGYKIAGASEGSGVQVTLNTENSNIVVAIAEYSNIVASPLDVTASDLGSAVEVQARSTGTTANTAQADELAIAMVGVRATNISGVSWTNIFTPQANLYTSGTDDLSLAWSHKILSTIGTQETTASWTDAGRAGGLIATFKKAAAVTKGTGQGRQGYQSINKGYLNAYRNPYFLKRR